MQKEPTCMRVGITQIKQKQEQEDFDNYIEMWP